MEEIPRMPPNQDPDAAADFLEAVLFGSAAEDGFDQATVDLSADLPLVEGYRLIRLLGEGGFGMVYLAEQRVPIRRRVAMKVLRPGTTTRELLARFEQERQALALMNHPHIAKIYDAGETEDGRPFITMELVEGRTIDRHAEKISLPDKVMLMRDVSRAVAHAHHKGVIHRDLKPSNILIAESVEGRGEPRVIDFGIAKALDGPLSAQVMFTQIRQVVGTPGYMSPERQHTSQISHIADTRADVFALGAILWELLTGRTPLQRADNGGTQIILPELKSVPAELRWITEKATDADMERRYPDAGGLADELDNYLLGLPLKAAPRSTRYVLHKWTQRHRTATAAVMIMALTLMVSAWVLVRNYTRLEAALSQTRESQTASQRTLSHVDYLLGLDHEKGDPVRAMAHWARALTNDPANEAARGMLASTLENASYFRPIGSPVSLPSGELRHLVISAEGRWAAMIWGEGERETLVRVQRGSTKVELHPIPADGRMKMLAISMNGHVALAGAQGPVGLMGPGGSWEASETTIPGQRALIWTPEEKLWCLGFQSVSLMDEHGKDVETPTVWQEQITCWDATDSGGFLGLGFESGSILVLDGLGLVPDRRTGLYPAPVMSLTLSEDGTGMAASWPDGRVWLSDKTGEEWSFRTEGVLDLQFLPRGDSLLVRGPEKLGIWNLSQRKPVLVEAVSHPLRDVIAMDEGHLLYLPTFGEAQLHAIDGEKTWMKLPGFQGRLSCATALQGSAMVLIEEDSRTLEWLAWQGHQATPSVRETSRSWATMRCVKHKLLGLDREGNVFQHDGKWNMKTLWNALQGPVRLGAMDAEGKTVLADVPWSQQLLTVQQGQPPVMRDWGVDRPSCLTLSADGSLAALGYPGGAIQIWDLKNNAQLVSRNWQRGPILSVAFVTQGQLALATGSQVILWHWPSAKQFVIPHEVQDGCVAMAADAKGNRLALATASGTVYVISTQTGLRISTQWEGSPKVAGLCWNEEGSGLWCVSHQGHLFQRRVPATLGKSSSEVERYLGVRLDGQGNLVRRRDGLFNP